MSRSLMDVMDGYLTALVDREPGWVPVDPGVRVTENGHPVEFGHGLFETATALTYRHVVADAAAGQVAAFTVIHEGDHPANAAVRLAVTDGAVTEIETVVARRGQSSIARPDKLHEPKPVYGEPLADADRRSRAELTAVADRYFQAIEDDTADVPFHPECNRTANGQQTTNRGPAPLSCLAQFEHRIFGYISRVRDRHYRLVDEDRGLVFATVAMDVPGHPEDFAAFPAPYDKLPAALVTPHTILLAELFKIVGGRIREIEALMVNVTLGATTGWSARR